MKVVFACFALVLTYTSLAQTDLYLDNGSSKLPGKKRFDVLKNSARKLSSSAEVQSKGIKEFFRRTGTVAGAATRGALNMTVLNTKKTQLAKVFRGYSLNSMSTKQAFTYSKAIRQMAKNPYATIFTVILSLAVFYFLQESDEDENKMLRERLFEYEKWKAEKKY